MPKQKRAKLNPLGTVPSSLRKARAVTSESHRLTHEQSLLRRTAAAAADLSGGHSSASAKAHSSSSFFLFFRPLEALEVGAINADLCVPWLRVSDIGLMSRHPRMRQLDFIAVRPRGAFDCLVNSMVINCVEPLDARAHVATLICAPEAGRPLLSDLAAAVRR